MESSDVKLGNELVEGRRSRKIPERPGSGPLSFSATGLNLNQHIVMGPNLQIPSRGALAWRQRARISLTRLGGPISRAARPTCIYLP